MQRILVATDGTDAASRAVETAARIAAAFHAQLNVLTVLDRPEAAEARELRRVEGLSVDEILSDDGRGMLKLPFDQAMTMHSSDIETKVSMGEPVKMILQGAQDCHADLIVLGRRQLHPVSAAFNTRVSEQVLKQSSCPVLIVP